METGGTFVLIEKMTFMYPLEPRPVQLAIAYWQKFNGHVSYNGY